MPNNAVEYFVSYYDYYQPEAYVPQTDTFIEKDSSINDEVERLRHSATNNLLTRRDTVVVASVSVSMVWVLRRSMWTVWFSFRWASPSIAMSYYAGSWRCSTPVTILLSPIGGRFRLRGGHGGDHPRV